MIQPITGLKLNNRTSFKGFYDPTCISVPASMKAEALSKAKEILPDAGEKINALLDNSPVQASLEHFKANFMTGLSDASPLDATRILEHSTSSKILDSANLINEHTGAITHMLPDGTLFDIGDSLPVQDVGADNGIADSLISFFKNVIVNIGDIMSSVS